MSTKNDLKQPESASEQPQDQAIEQLQQQLEEANAKAEENWNEYLRARADLDNTRKRAMKDVDNARKFSIEKVAKELLDVLDGFDQGLQSTESYTSDEAKAMREGMIMAKKMLLGVFEKFEINTIEAETGTPFDPKQHEAISMQENDEYAHNTVIAVMQNGYMLHDRILRPARVVVSRSSKSV